MMSPRPSRLALVAAALLPLLAPSAWAQQRASIQAPRGALEITLPGQSAPLAGQALAGITLNLGAGLGALRIAGARPDPMDATGETWLYDLRRQDAAGAWETPACAPGPDGTQAAIFLPAEGGGVAPFCTGANPAKCVRLGYAPWRTAPDGRSLAPFHAACQRMLPAEYAADGRFHTRNGMRIEIFDFAGVNDPENIGGMPFEAGWTPDGAVCVAHLRVPEVTDAAHFAGLYPGMADRYGPQACTEDTARALGGLVFNRSIAE